MTTLIWIYAIGFVLTFVGMIAISTQDVLNDGTKQFDFPKIVLASAVWPLSWVALLVVTIVYLVSERN